MGIGTLSLEYLEYGQSHLSDGARRSLRRPRWGTMITANGAQTKAEFKRCIARRDRRAFTVELPVVVDDGPDFDAIAMSGSTR